MLTPSSHTFHTQYQMRIRPMLHFEKIMDQYNLGDPSKVLVIGADADEIATGEAVWHLSHCEIKGNPDLNKYVVYFGTLMAKYAAHQLQVLGDGICAADNQAPLDLARTVWGSGPVAKTLEQACRDKQSPRVQPGKVGCPGNGRGKTKKVLHLPVGSAIHLSSLAEPSMRFMKDAGTVEGGSMSRRRMDLRKFAFTKFMVFALLRNL